MKDFIKLALFDCADSVILKKSYILYIEPTSRYEGCLVVRCEEPLGVMRVLGNVDDIYAQLNENPRERPNDEIVGMLKEALERIRDYWNGDSNNSAMFDACNHNIKCADIALARLEVYEETDGEYIP